MKLHWILLEKKKKKKKCTKIGQTQPPALKGWVGCYDRRERLSAFEEERAFVHRSFLIARRKAKVGYTQEEQEEGAKERDTLQKRLDEIKVFQDGFLAQ